MMKSIRKTLYRARLAVTTFANDGRGVAAIEFAMLLPIMLMLFFGTVIFSSGIAANRKVTLMAQTFSNLVSQNYAVTGVQLQNFFNADAAIMTPYDSTMTSAIISELYIDPTTLIPKVEWSLVYNGTGVPVASQLSAHSAGNPLSPNPVPGSLAVPGTYLIYSEIQYLFTAPAAGAMGFMRNGVTMKDVGYTRPRQSTCVIYPTPVSGALPACPQ
jgi:Flp pilus assembly protein TadG